MPGDQEEYGTKYFETFVPDMQWRTIRILLNMILLNKWGTITIDYINAFPQANIDTYMCMDIPTFLS